MGVLRGVAIELLRGLWGVAGVRIPFRNKIIVLVVL